MIIELNTQVFSVANRHILKCCSQLFCSGCHSQMGCPFVCRKHMPTPRWFAQLQPGSSRSTLMHVPLFPSLRRWERTLTETLWKQILSVFGQLTLSGVYAYISDIRIMHSVGNTITVYRVIKHLSKCTFLRPSWEWGEKVNTNLMSERS